MSLKEAGRYPRYRAPAGDGETLCVPPWSEAAALLQANRAATSASSSELWGHSQAHWSRAARTELLSAALRFTRQYAEVGETASGDIPFVLTGHQPGFVHPGVWLKNFAAARLANNAGGVAINLVIDSDLCRSTSILVPAGTVAEPRSEHVAFDAGLAQMPWEERPLVDTTNWSSFGSRASETIAPLVCDPLLSEWWPQVKERPPSGLSTALTQVRHRLELDWGIATLELPQSAVCQTRSFREFAVALLADAARFRTAHNEALAEYRREHKLRNHAQPVPDLAIDDGWIEAPFWLWAKSDPTRRAVFVKAQSGKLLVTDRAGFENALPLEAMGCPANAVEQLAAWESRGVKLRTRALVTTMFARLLLADLFIHGIGGAKYDQVTDQICERLFGFQPPAHLTLTGTLRLPISHALAPPSREWELRRELRELEFHPERVKSSCTEGPRWSKRVAEKRRWVDTTKTPANAAERHRQIVAANAALAACLTAERAEIEQELAALAVARRASHILDSREYAYCLFNRELLQGFLLDFPARMA